MNKPKKRSVSRYAKTLYKEFQSNSLTVFLCGPSYTKRPEAGAELRFRLEQALTNEGFEVVPGEDDGLVSLQETYGKYAHQNEREFVTSQAAAIVLVADSAGSLCELGMFADRITELNSPAQAFVVLMEERYKGDNSYINLGPAKVVEDMKKLIYADFSNFNESEVVDYLKRLRTVVISERRGRPRRRTPG